MLCIKREFCHGSNCCAIDRWATPATVSAVDARMAFQVRTNPAMVTLLKRAFVLASPGLTQAMTQARPPINVPSSPEATTYPAPSRQRLIDVGLDQISK